jgi:hypothetical protein
MHSYILFLVFDDYDYIIYDCINWFKIQEFNKSIKTCEYKFLSEKLLRI